MGSLTQEISRSVLGHKMPLLLVNQFACKLSIHSICVHVNTQIDEFCDSFANLGEIALRFLGNKKGMADLATPHTGI